MLNTQKIDRLSNNKLTLGLKTGLTLEASSSRLLINKPIQYSVDDAVLSALSTNDLVHKGYVDTVKTTLEGNIDYALKSRIVGSERISVSYDENAKTKTISLGDAYDSNIREVDYFKANNKVVFTGQTDTTYGGFAGESGQNLGLGSGNVGDGAVITAIHVDKYGAVRKVDYKKISTSDLDNTGGVYDNYRGWKLTAGGKDLAVTSGWDPDAPTEIEGYETINQMSFAGEGIAISYKDKVLTFSPNIAAGDDLTLKDGAILHSTKLETAAASGLYKTAISTTGHITSATAVTANDLVTLISDGGAILGSVGTTFSAGLVPFKTDSNLDNTPTADTYYLTSEGKWAKVSFDSVTLTENTTAVPIVGVAANKSISDLQYNATATVDQAGNISAASFSGDGSGLNNLDATKVTTGTLSSDRLPVVSVDKGGLGKSINTIGSGLLVSNGTAYNTVKPSADGNYLISTSGTTFNFKEIDEFLQDYLSEADAMQFKGTIGSGGTVNVTEGGSIDLTTSVGTFQAGWTYKAVSNFTITDGDKTHTVEPGDLITAIKDSTETSGPYWVVTQANIDGAVTSTATSAQVGELTVFADTTGRAIKSSGIVFDGSVLNVKASSATTADSAAVAGKLESAITIWGNEFDGSKSLTETNTIKSGHIEPVTTETYNIGSEDKKYSKIYATNFHGTADKVANKIKIAGKEFDGSSEVEITLTDLNGITNVVMATTPTASAGKVISKLEATTNSSEVVLTPTYVDSVSSITFDLFDLTNTDGSIVIKPATSNTSGKIWKSNIALGNGSASISTLGYGGNFYSDAIYTKDISSQKIEQVLTRIFVPDADASNFSGEVILVADYDDSDLNNKNYGFKASTRKIATSAEIGSSMNSDSIIPTANAVKEYVTAEVNKVSTSAIKTIDILFEPGSDSSSTITKSTAENFFASKTQIRRVAVEVSAADINLETGLVIKYVPNSGADVVLSGTDDNILTETGVYINDCYYTTSAIGKISVSLTLPSGVSSASGLSAVVHIDYANPTQI